jgi:hypothetical protein
MLALEDLRMKTGTLLLLTVLFALGGLALIGGGIAYLVWDAGKQRKAARQRNRFPGPSAGPSFPPTQDKGPASK